MDLHFRSADWHENVPALLALVGLWHNQVSGHATRAVLPYDNRCRASPPTSSSSRWSRTASASPWTGTP
jgi:hypothetical protein